MQQGVGFSRTFEFDIPQIELGPDQVFYNFEGTLEISRTSEGLLARGGFRAATDIVCGRCLEAALQVLETEFTELYTFASHKQEDTELVLPEDGRIDFGPLIGEYLALEVPINPVCAPDCQGLCSICGNNLNTEPCDHGTEEIDPRFEILKTLLED